MNVFLPELLNAAAAIFVRAGQLPAETLRSAAGATWVPAELKESLDRMLAANREDLAVAYADHFLVSQAHPLLYLEASVHRTGLLRDPELLEELELIYAVLGFTLPEGRSPDHLATELEALAAGLQRLGAIGEEDHGPLFHALNALMDRHLHPLITELKAKAATRPMHPAYAEALATASLAEELARSGLQTFA